MSQEDRDPPPPLNPIIISLIWQDHGSHSAKHGVGWVVTKPPARLAEELSRPRSPRSASSPRCARKRPSRKLSLPKISEVLLPENSQGPYPTPQPHPESGGHGNPLEGVWVEAQETGG